MERRYSLSRKSENKQEYTLTERMNRDHCVVCPDIVRPGQHGLQCDFCDRCQHTICSPGNLTDARRVFVFLSIIKTYFVLSTHVSEVGNNVLNRSSMDRNTISDGVLVTYDVRTGRYKPNRSKITGVEHAMGTYTPRILRGSEFFIGDSSEPKVVFSTEDGVRNSSAVKCRSRGRRDRDSDVFVLLDDFSHDVADDAAPLLAQNDSSLSVFDSLKPFYFTMAAFGICNPCFNFPYKVCNIAIRLYSGVTVLLMWINLVRLLCCFREDEGMEGFVLKISIIAWFFCGTVFVSFSQWIWRKAVFPAIFTDIQKMNFICDLRNREKLRNIALGLSVVGYILTFALTGFGLYAMFGFSKIFTIHGVDLAVCPRQGNEGDVILKILFIISLLLTSSCWTFFILQHFLLSFILCLHFSKFHKEFQSALSEDRDVHRKFEKYRQRHLTVCDLVERVDQAVFPWTSVTFLINILIAMALISHLLLSDFSNTPDRIASGIFLLLALLSIVEVMCSGVCVHRSGRLPLNTLLHHRIVSASSENCLQINLFLYQLTQESRGLTIFRLFTVTKTTVLIVMLLLVTYLSALLHVIPGSTKDLTEEQRVNNITFP